MKGGKASKEIYERTNWYDVNPIRCAERCKRIYAGKGNE